MVILRCLIKRNSSDWSVCVSMICYSTLVHPFIYGSLRNRCGSLSYLALFLCTELWILTTEYLLFL